MSHDTLLSQASQCWSLSSSSYLLSSPQGRRGQSAWAPMLVPAGSPEVGSTSKSLLGEYGRVASICSPVHIKKWTLSMEPASSPPSLQARGFAPCHCVYLCSHLPAFRVAWYSMAVKPLNFVTLTQQEEDFLPERVCVCHNDQSTPKWLQGDNGTVRKEAVGKGAQVKEKKSDVLISIHCPVTPPCQESCTWLV